MVLKVYGIKNFVQVARDILGKEEAVIYYGSKKGRLFLEARVGRDLVYDINKGYSDMKRLEMDAKALKNILKRRGLESSLLEIDR